MVQIHSLATILLLFVFNSTYEDDSQYNDFVTQCKNLVNEFKEKEPRFTDDNLVSSVRLHKYYKEQGIRKLYVTLITGFSN